MTTIIFDNDAANDDVIALIYLASHPEVNLAAITIAGTGEAHGPRGAKNLADLCYMLGKSNVPIAYGSSQPCDESGKLFPEFVRAMMDNIFVNKAVPMHPNPVITNSAIDLIKTIILSSNEPVSILATGPLTNIAEFIKTHPELAKKIEKVVIMGGAVNVKGNIEALDQQSGNKVAEWNIYADPKAAEIVFSSGVPVTLVPLDATNQVPMTSEFYHSLSQSLQPGLKLIYELLKVIVAHFDMDLFLKEFYLWDPLAAMICIDPKLAISESMSVLMDLKTAQTKCVDKGTVGSALINVVTKIPNAHLILKKFIDETKSNLLNNQSTVTPISIYPTQNIPTGIFQQSTDVPTVDNRFN
jgi:inosine-uridine nucleoside N-ribohydrolase